MADQQVPLDNADFFGQASLRIMERFQCSADEAAVRLHASLQTLLQPLEPQLPPPPPPPTPPLLPIPIPNDNPVVLSKKKPTYVDFNLETPIPDRIPLTPSEYAVGKMQNIEYVELWYFTTEGRNDAGKISPSVANNTYSLADTTSGLALQPIKASKASRNVVIDESLSWEQVMTARHSLIATATEVGWDEKLTYALAQFYIKLESAKADGDNPRALILYHAASRRLWHDALLGRGKPFNISIFNAELYKKFKNQVRDTDSEETKRQASPFSSSSPTCTMVLTPLSSLLSQLPPPLIPPFFHPSFLSCHAMLRNTSFATPCAPSSSSPMQHPLAL